MNLAKKVIRVHEGKEPKEIKSIWDNGGKTVDQYTFIFSDEWSGYDQHKKDGGVKKDMFMALGTDNEGGRSFSQWTDSMEGKHLGKKVKWAELDKVVQNHVTSRIKED